MQVILERIEKSIKYWYALLISGIIFMGAGILAFFFGKATFLTLTLLFSLSFLFSGISETVFALSNRKGMKHWGWSMTMGIFDIVFGVFLLAHPFVTVFVLTLFVGFAILFHAIGGIILSINLKKTRYSKWWSLLAFSILGVIAALFLIVRPLIASALLVAVTGIALIAGGVFSVILSILLRKLNQLKKEIDTEKIKAEADIISWYREEQEVN